MFCLISCFINHVHIYKLKLIQLVQYNWSDLALRPHGQVNSAQVKSAKLIHLTSQYTLDELVQST